MGPSSSRTVTPIWYFKVLPSRLGYCLPGSEGLEKVSTSRLHGYLVYEEARHRDSRAGEQILLELEDARAPSRLRIATRLHKLEESRRSGGRGASPTRRKVKDAAEQDMAESASPRRLVTKPSVWGRIPPSSSARSRRPDLHECRTASVSTSRPTWARVDQASPRAVDLAE